MALYGCELKHKLNSLTDTWMWTDWHLNVNRTKPKSNMNLILDRLSFSGHCHSWPLNLNVCVWPSTFLLVFGALLVDGGLVKRHPSSDDRRRQEVIRVCISMTAGSGHWFAALDSDGDVWRRERNDSNRCLFLIIRAHISYIYTDMLYISQHRHLNDWFNLENVKLSDVCPSIRPLTVTTICIFTNNFLRIIYSRLE